MAYCGREYDARRTYDRFCGKESQLRHTFIASPHRDAPLCSTCGHPAPARNWPLAVTLERSTITLSEESPRVRSPPLPHGRPADGRHRVRRPHPRRDRRHPHRPGVLRDPGEPPLLRPPRRRRPGRRRPHSGGAPRRLRRRPREHARGRRQGARAGSALGGERRAAHQGRGPGGGARHDARPHHERRGGLPRPLAVEREGLHRPGDRPAGRGQLVRPRVQGRQGAHPRSVPQADEAGSASASCWS